MSYTMCWLIKKTEIKRTIKENIEKIEFNSVVTVDKTMGLGLSVIRFSVIKNHRKIILAL